MRIKKDALFLFSILFFMSSRTNETSTHSLHAIQPWRPIQKQVRNSVMQVFSMIAEFDWLQPYRTPNQYGVRGSGFLISENGYVITNFHVVEQAVAVWIQMPSFGKRPIKVEVVSVCPERDIALLKITEDDLNYIKEVLGKIPFLALGNSDFLRRTDKVLALGFPLGMQSLKSTTGIISGREQHLIQMSAAVNPGSSGGPLFNIEGEVVGINTSSIINSHSVEYAIPINTLKLILSDLYKVPLIRKPYLGIISIKVNDDATDYLGNPQPGGCYVVEVVKNSPLERAGIQSGDMIYEINGYKLDIYGEMNVPWSEEDKISFADYIGRLVLGEKVDLVIYRRGERIETAVSIDNSDVAPIRRMYPWQEEIDYEVFAGMVVMQLTLNHVHALGNQAPGLKLYGVINNQSEPVVVISHIFPNSSLAQIRSIAPGFTINKINDISVQTLDDFRQAIQKSLETGYLTIKTTDQITCASDNILAILPFDDACKETITLAQMYHYPISKSLQELLKKTGFSFEAKSRKNNSWH